MANNSKILAALAAGVAIGSVLGILFAPDKGEHTRKKIADNGRKLTDSLKEKVSEGKEQLSSLGNNFREKVDNLKSQVNEFVG